MPRSPKKLTKTQTTKLLKEINIRLFKLFEDKAKHGATSFVPMSAITVVKNFLDPIGRALNRVK